MPDLKIEFPFGGVSEQYALTNQPAGTTRDALNVRGCDPISGRLRGATRSGTSEYAAVDVYAADTKVLRLDSVSYDNRLVTYANVAAGSIAADWSVTPPTQRHTFRTAVDRDGNVYNVSGEATIAKYNSKGTEQWRLQLPAINPKHQVVAFDVGDDFSIYAAATCAVGRVFGNVTPSEAIEAATNDDVRIWRFVQGEDNTTTKIWELNPGGFVADLKVRNNQLYVLVNNHETRTGTLIVYNQIDTAVPDVALKRFAPYRSVGLDVTKDGSILVCAERAERVTIPQAQNFGPINTSWTPWDLVDAKKRIWAWYDAQNIDGVDSERVYENNEEVLEWHDLSGNDRTLFPSLGVQDCGNFTLMSGPKYKSQGVGGLPAVQFSGFEPSGLGGSPGANSVNGVGKVSELETQPNSTITASSSDDQSSFLPSYQGAAWAMVMVLRPNVDSLAPEMILAQQTRDSLGNKLTRQLVTNQQCPVSPGAVVTAQGHIRWIDKTGATLFPATGTTYGSPYGLQPISYDFATGNTTGVIVLSIIYDGGVAPAASPSASNTRCMLRVNGTTVTRWEGAEIWASLPALLGKLKKPFTEVDNDPTPAVEKPNMSFGKFNLAEMVVLDRKRVAGVLSTTEPIVVGHTEVTISGGTSPTELEYLEGYMAYRWGVHRQLNPAHYFYATSSGPFKCPQKSGVAFGDTNDTNRLFLTNSMLAKFSATGELRWIDTTTNGVGYSVIVSDPDNNLIVSAGPNPTTGDDVFWVKFTDAATGAPTAGGTAQMADGVFGTCAPSIFPFMRMATDTLHNTYIPSLADDATSAAALRGGFQLTIVDNVAGSSATLLQYLSSVTASFQRCFSVSVPPAVPTYQTGLASQRAEFAYVGLDDTNTFGSAVQPSLRSLRLVSVASSTGSTRAKVDIAVSGGRVRRYTTSAVTAFAGASTLAEPQLDSAAQYVNSTVAFGEVFLTDGKTYVVANPKTDTVLAWKATSSGEIPPRCSLVATWRGRVVLARSPEDGHNWHMSAQGDPYNWDNSPPTINLAQAVNGTNAERAGLVPDIITALIPYSDDLMFFGCDSSIYRMTGDPMAGGQIDLVTDITGVSFGRSWCKDPQGILYFHGSQGRIYRMVPGGQPEPFSDRIFERLSSIDLADYFVELVWNDEDDGLHVFRLPYSAGGTQVEHYFWEKATDSWWPDSFAAGGFQPTAVSVLDGDDPTDRVMILGGHTGRIYTWDDAAKSDNGQAFESRVLIGPLVDENSESEVRFTRWTATLASDQGGANYSLYVTSTPETLGNAFVTGALGPGRSPTLSARLRGTMAYLKLSSVAVGQRWAFERGSIEVYPAGRQRVR